MIEKVLYCHMSSDVNLAPLLSSYQMKPAIFLQIAPNDTDNLWDNNMHYARIVFDIDTNTDTARKIAGTLRADVICSGQSKMPEEINPVLKNIIDGYFFSSDGEVFAAVWERTDNFDTEPDSKVFGNVMTFSLLAFPAQTTADPDPVALMNDWTAKLFPDAVVIGKNKILEVMKPTDERPALYWSLSGIMPSSIPSTYHCTWNQSNLRLSVIAPSKNVRNAIVKRITERLTADGRVMFPDGNQFLIHRMAVEANADPIRTGQLTLEGSFSILRKYPGSNPLSDCSIKNKELIRDMSTKAKNNGDTAAVAAGEKKKSSAELTDFQKSVFSADEFAAMSEKFNTTPDIVKAALRLANVSSATFAQAEKIVNKFKEV